MRPATIYTWKTRFCAILSINGQLSKLWTPEAIAPSRTTFPQSSYSSLSLFQSFRIQQNSFLSNFVIFCKFTVISSPHSHRVRPRHSYVIASYSPCFYDSNASKNTQIEAHLAKIQNFDVFSQLRVHLRILEDYSRSIPTTHHFDLFPIICDSIRLPAMSKSLYQSQNI